MQPFSRLCCTWSLGLVITIAWVPSVPAQDPLHQRIDQLIAKKKATYAKEAAPAASDAEFLRRVYLDLTGVIPAVADAKAFLDDKAPTKRQQLVDRLLASEGFARHLTNVFDVLLMDRRPDKHVKSPEWREHLRAAFAANKPYDQLAREILSADGADPKQRPAARFFLDRDGDAHVLTKDISRVFLGKNLQCAQCHDHPLVEAYKQDHYYGIYAFLNRSFVFTEKGSKQAILAEKGDGDVSFQSVFVKVTKNTGPRLLDGPALTEPKLDKGKEYVVPYKPGEKPRPKFSRRAFLAKTITDTPVFARATANRLWSFYLGRGLIHPVEYDHPSNPPSHPELLDALAADLSARKFDLKAFIKDIVLSQTYQRGSELPKGAADPDPADYVVANLRPLSPEQLAWSMMQATGLIDAQRKAMGPKATEHTVFNALAGNVANFVRLFGNQPGEPTDPTAFEATLDQTLFLKNGDQLRGWLAPRLGNLTQRLGEIKDSSPLADELYLSILTRLPSADERKETADFLASRAADRPQALQDLVWALVTSAEFRFNH